MPSGIYGSPTLGDFRDSATTYPVQVTFIIPAHNSRFYAVPIIGFALRQLFLIPHLFTLALVGIAVVLLQFVLWVPVLILARYPKWAYTFVGGYLRWAIRLQAFSLGLTDAYPPF